MYKNRMIYNKKVKKYLYEYLIFNFKAQVEHMENNLKFDPQMKANSILLNELNTIATLTKNISSFIEKD